MKNKGLLHPGVTNVTQEEDVISYLFRRNSTYYFRRVVPESLRPYLLTKSGKPRTEFMISLGTKDLKEAKVLSGKQFLKVESLIGQAQRRLDAGMPPDSSGNQAVSLARWQANYDSWETEQFALQHDDFLQREHEEQLKAELIDAKIRLLDRPYNELSDDEKIQRDIAQPEFFDSAAMKAQRDRVRQTEWNAAGMAANTRFERFLATGEFMSTYPSLMRIFDAYVKAKENAPASVKKWRGIFEHLISFLGHDDASKLTFDRCREWRDFVQSERLEKGKVRAVRTVRDYVNTVKAMLNHAWKERIIKVNPIAGLEVWGGKPTILRANKGFTDEEAKTILNAALSISLEQANINLSEEMLLARRWVPWLCAYTGARVNEITQLREMDIQQRDGIWLIRITPEAGSVKTKAAREVPLHPHLIRQGFHKLAVEGSETPIFYNPARGRGGSAANPHYKKVGERLAEWIHTLGAIVKGEVAPNHGWRHLFKTRARSADLDSGAQDAIQGHAAASEGQNYGGWTIQALNREMRKLPDFELEATPTAPDSRNAP